MFDTPIEIYRYTEQRDEYNDRVHCFNHFASCYAQKTENGGRENLYAGRIVHENEIIYTIRYREGIEAGMVILENGRRMKITSVQQEGRRWRLHLRVTKSDADETPIIPR